VRLKKGVTAKVSPKFCGLRVEDPSISSMNGYCGYFESEPLCNGDAPPEWESERNLRCTESELAALRSLRARLEADGVEGPKDCITMLRVVRARKENIDAGAEMYVKMRKWYKTEPAALGFLERTIDDTIHRCLDAHWPPTGLLGHDLDGDPIYWIRPGNVRMQSMVELSEEFLVEHEIYSCTRILEALQEDAIRQRRPLMSMTVVVDLGDLSREVVHPRFGMKYRRCVRIAEDYFPEMVKRVVMVRAPFWLPGVWATVSLFFDEGTRGKFQIVDTHRTHDALARVMDSKWIPEALGGSNRLGGNEWCGPAISDGGGPSEQMAKQLAEEYEKSLLKRQKQD
jgi:hypothetical protein